MAKGKEDKKEHGLFVYALLDESGSMQGYREIVIKAFNEFVQRLNMVAMPATISAMKFGQGIRKVIDARPAYEMPELTKATYDPGGGTPMCMCMGQATVELDAIKARQKVMIILTDGGDGSYGQKYDQDWVNREIPKRIQQGWLFIYIRIGHPQNTQPSTDFGIPEKWEIKIVTKIEGCMEQAAEATLHFQETGKADFKRRK